MTPFRWLRKRRVRRRLTRELAIIDALETGEPMAALEICAALGLQSGTVHPALARLERSGIVTSYWGTQPPGDERQPRRRYYRLVGDVS